jgi:hypothetical protein
VELVFFLLNPEPKLKNPEKQLFNTSWGGSLDKQVEIFERVHKVNW